MTFISILEDNLFQREALESYLNATGRYKILSSSSSYKEFVAEKIEIQPDFILLDVHLEDALGIDLIRNIKQTYDSSNIIIVTGDTNKELLLKAMENGACAFIYKPFSMTELEKTIDQINLTGSFLEPQVLTKLLGLINEKKKVDRMVFNDVLTTREEQILELITKGNKYKDIAKLLNISFHTVNFHLKNVYQKTNVNSKAELVAKYFNLK